MIRIKLYQSVFQNEIDAMLQEIATEFEQSISNEFVQTGKLVDEYWVAFYNNEIVGTIAVLDIENKNAVLKRMFVKKAYRGKKYEISKLLLQKVFDWCHLKNMENIYLGTMSQFKAAHRFYEKNGFQKIQSNELPLTFKNNPVDDVFYKKVLKVQME